MKICMVHNAYGKLSGEEIVVSNVRRLVEEHGHLIFPFFRSSEEIAGTFLGNIRAFFSGIHSEAARKAFAKLLDEHRPDVVHIHNLYPLISASILPECKKKNVPVVMTVHNYRLICPNGLFMSKGRICERCSGGHEWWCVINNCERSIPKSLGYAFRNYIARKKKLFLDNVTMYATLTEFQRQCLIRDGFPGGSVEVIPNFIEYNGSQDSSSDKALGEYIAFVGRISPEKGVQTLINASRIIPHLSIKAAGSLDRMPSVVEQAPRGFQFCGHLSASEVRDHIRLSRFVVLPSIWYEGFPMVILEAFQQGRPVICSRIGGLSEIVEDGISGLLFEHGDAEDLAKKIRYLWDHPGLCVSMGERGRKKVLTEYSPSQYFSRLMALYRKAIPINRGLQGKEIDHSKRNV